MKTLKFRNLIKTGLIFKNDSHQLKKLLQIDVHVVVCFKYVGHLMALAAKPLEQHEGLDGEIGVGVDEAFLQDVSVRLTLVGDVALEGRILQLTHEEDHLDVRQLLLETKFQHSRGGTGSGAWHKNENQRHGRGSSVSKAF